MLGSATRQPHTRQVVALCIGLSVVLSACADDAKRPRSAGSRSPAPGTPCGLPEVEAAAEPDLVPAALVLDDPEVEIAQTFARRDRLVATLNVGGSVQETFRAYRAAIPDSPFELLQIDNEGFEAELYLQQDKDFAVIQIRASKCDDESLVILNLPSA